tara:strand:- start:128 stop:271 length:144 start_codon:yes stop_codon:yes gene_type:complete
MENDFPLFCGYVFFVVYSKPKNIAIDVFVSFSHAKRWSFLSGDRSMD